MKETKIIAKAANFTATDFGKMSEIKDYTLELGPEIRSEEHTSELQSQR